MFFVGKFTLNQIPPISYLNLFEHVFKMYVFVYMRKIKNDKELTSFRK